MLTAKNGKLPSGGDCVIYHMSRDQRVEDNHALIYAQGLAESRKVPLRVVFNLVPKFLEATVRQYGFMMDGLKEVESALRDKEIPFYLTMGNPVEKIPEFVEEHNAVALVCDFSPLRVPLMWTSQIAAAIDEGKSSAPVVQVDAHNIVPVWIASPKLEYGARTLRGKLEKLLPTYLKQDMPPTKSNLDYASPPADGGGSFLKECNPVDWNKAMTTLEIDRTVKEVTWLRPGAAGARATFETFCTARLKDYGAKRNDPNLLVASEMSPYFHFGQISVQRCIMQVKALRIHSESTNSFVEEAVVRRELSDNFCFYNKQYDSLDGCYDWAKTSLRLHWDDKREYLYTQEQLDKAKTHDDLWNAAQIQLTTIGKMHGFLRMYWAKKILEWSENPSEALRIAIYLNDRYSLDGRDPNGYVGCMWSIGGIHDQGWGERAVFGKIRYMNYAGCKRKFSVKDFVDKYPPAAENAKAAPGPTTGQTSVASFFSVKK
jgi:deoxyribodipyrimidine photo-lyase